MKPSRSGVQERLSTCVTKGLPISLRIATILSGVPQIITYTTLLIRLGVQERVVCNFVGPNFST